MGSFNDYLKSLKDTPEYIAAEIYDEFTESVWRIRRQKGIKQKEIAEKMGVSPSYLSKQLSGRQKLTISAICKIAHALNCDVKIELVPKESAEE